MSKVDPNVESTRVPQDFPTMKLPRRVEVSIHYFTMIDLLNDCKPLVIYTDRCIYHVYPRNYMIRLFIRNGLVDGLSYDTISERNVVIARANLEKNIDKMPFLKDYDLDTLFESTLSHRDRK